MLVLDTDNMNKNSGSLSKWHQVSEGVFVARSDQFKTAVSIGSSEISELKECAKASKRKRARICAHLNNSDALHQMILVVQRDSYVRPHRHRGKVESFHLIEGEMDVALFSETGELIESIPLCAYPSGNGSIFYRLDRQIYHTLLIHSPYVVFQEITQGPFDVQQSDYASWAPEESDLPAAALWMSELKKKVCSS